MLIEEKGEINWLKKLENTIYPRYHYRLPTISLASYEAIIQTGITYKKIFL